MSRLQRRISELIATRLQKRALNQDCSNILKLTNLGVATSPLPIYESVASKRKESEDSGRYRTLFLHLAAVQEMSEIAGMVTAGSSLKEKIKKT